MYRNPVSISSSPEDLFRLLERTNSSDVILEVKQLIYEQLSEVKGPWLVNGLFDTYLVLKSSRILELLLNIRDPHDRYLCDKISDCLKQGGKQRGLGLDVLGFVIRRRPAWLYRIAQYSLLKDLLKVLKTENNVVMMLTGLLGLTALLPALPVNIGPFLDDVFEVFSRVSLWRCVHLKTLPEVQQVHVQVALFAFFHRLYGLFPCNFLSYLRSQYSEATCSKDVQKEDYKERQLVFLQAVRPMLCTVRMHPMLVTHSRDQEKASSRWNQMEAHDVMVESSKYSLVRQECGREDVRGEREVVVGGDVGILPFFDSELSVEIGLLLGYDPLWTPGQVCGLYTPPRSCSSAYAVQSPGVGSRGTDLDSSPEAAIEATPETTPFITPIKDESFRFVRPLSSGKVSRSLLLDSAGTGLGVKSHSLGKTTAPVSPNKDASLFRFPDSSRVSVDVRRDSLFDLGALGAARLASSRPSADRETVTTTNTSSTDTSTLTSSTVAQSGSSFSAVAVSSSALLASAVANEDPLKGVAAKPTLLLGDSGASFAERNIKHRPSPVKFTSQRPEQFPIKPTPERLSVPSTEEVQEKAVRHKMLSLETLKDALTDFGKEEDDDEVTKLTGGSDDPSGHNMGTRHITPHFCSGSSSAGNSGATSRLSSSSQAEKSRPATSTLDAAHPVKNAAAAAKADRQFDESKGPSKPPEVEVVASPSSLFKTPESVSCPDFSQLERKASQTLEGDITDAEAQTDDVSLFPYEHLFPCVLPQWINRSPDPSGAAADDHVNPYNVLDQFIKASCDKATHVKQGGGGGSDVAQIKMLQDEVAMLHAQLLYERHRREALGLRNRRLLRKTKASYTLEEQNASSRDQLQIRKTEIVTLFDQLEAVRKEKHEVEDGRAANAKQRDEEIEKLVSENNKLIQERLELVDKTAKQKAELEKARMEMEMVELACFNSMAEAEILKRKDAERLRAEKQVLELRKEVLLLGELLRKHREKPTYETDGEQMKMFCQTSEHQISQLEATLVSRTNELEVCKGKMRDLEAAVANKEQAIVEQKRFGERIMHGVGEERKEAEAAYRDLVETNLQLECRVLELQDQMAKMSSGRRSGARSLSASASRSTASPPSPEFGDLLQESADGILPPAVGKERGPYCQSANVDIARPPVMEMPEKSSFFVGSPPSSGEGLGFDQSEVIRRALEASGPISLERARSGSESPPAPYARARGSRLDTSSPEIGSAEIDDKELLEMSSESLNGNHD